MFEKISQFLIGIDIDGSAVDSSLSKIGNRIKNGLQRIVRRVIAPIIGAAAIRRFFNQYISAADSLGLFSNQVGIAVDQLSAFQRAFESVGGSAAAFQSVLQSIQSKIPYHSGRNALDVLRQVSQQAKNYGSLRQFQQVVAARFGIDKNTAALIHRNGDEIERLARVYKELALTQEDADVARKYRSNLVLLSAAFQKLAAGIFRVVTPAVTLFTDKLTKFVIFISRHEKTVLAFFLAIIAVIGTRLVPLILSILIPAIKALGLAILANPFALLAIALVGVIALIDDFVTFLQGGQSQFEDFYKRFGPAEEQLAKWLERWEKAKVILGLAKEQLSVLIGLFKNAFGPALESALEIFDKWLDLLEALFKGDISGILSALEGILISAADLVVNYLKGIVDLLIINPVKAVLSLIPGAESAIQGFKDALNYSVGDAQLDQYYATSGFTPPPTATNNSVNTTEIVNNIGTIEVIASQQNAQGIAASVGLALQNTLRPGALVGNTNQGLING